jgi:uncharacterized protein DUF6364
VASLTLAIDDELLKRARIRALEQDTSVNSLVRDYLEEFATGGTHPLGMVKFLELAESIRAGSGPGGRSWKRDELHER